MRNRPITFRIGDRSPFIADAQEMLLKNGFDPGLQSGFFIPQTEDAVRMFQRARNMQPTGVLDCDTLRQLYERGSFPANLLEREAGDADFAGRADGYAPSGANTGDFAQGRRYRGAPDERKKTIVISVAERALGLYEGGRLVRKYRVAVGKQSTPTPVGRYEILEKILYPGGALGSRWMAFTHEMHGIHGTSRPELIGEAVSNGCVRMHNRDVEELYEMVDVGTPVEVIQAAVEAWPTLGKQAEQPQPVGVGPKSPKDPIMADIPVSRTYVVQPGDTLWFIAQRMGTTVDILVAANRLQNPDLIHPGQVLRVP